MPQFAPGAADGGSLSHDSLIAGEFPRVTRDVTLLQGQNVARGTLLGRVTASGKYVKSLAASNDGSEVPRAILVDDVDATAADEKAAIYETGEFNEAALVLGAGHTVAAIRDGLRALGIHLKSVQAA